MELIEVVNLDTIHVAKVTRRANLVTQRTLLAGSYFIAIYNSVKT